MNPLPPGCQGEGDRSRASESGAGEIDGRRCGHSASALSHWEKARGEGVVHDLLPSKREAVGVPIP
jgi:hypothetical protein